MADSAIQLISGGLGSEALLTLETSLNVVFMVLVLFFGFLK
jgi:hypothetical protein